MKFSEQVELFIDTLEAGEYQLVEGVALDLVREKWLPIIRRLEALKGSDDGTEKCMECDSMVEQVWHVDDELWNNISGYPEGNGILCTRCFDRKAQELGIYLYWTCQLNSYPKMIALLEEQDDES
jgi:hypothetical protein